MVRHQALTVEDFTAGVRALMATVARFRPSQTDAEAVLDAWRRIVFPACYGREHWLLALDRLMAEFKDMPKPADAVEILEQLAPAYAPPAPEDESSLPSVSANQEELAREYLDWRLYAARTSIREDLRLWEVHRFGHELHPSPHAVLLCAVLCEAYPNDHRSRRIRKGTDPERAT